MRLVSYLTFCSLMILSPAITTSQAAKSELVGEVRDQNGALVPNAKVTLTDAATGQTSDCRDHFGTHFDKRIDHLVIGV